MNYFVHLVRFLYKGCINRGKDGAWSHCSVAKVEKTKIVLRLLPLFLSSMIGYVSNPILLTFTVQHGGMTNTRLGKIHVSPATLFIIPITFQTVMLAVYDRFIVTFLRRRTGYASGITHLQRISIGFISMIQLQLSRRWLRERESKLQLRCPCSGSHLNSFCWECLM
jgi:solute carrier family 15 (peptide/histidine transporter), member 3/4